MIFFLLAFIVPVIAFFFEAYPRFFNRKFGVDIWTHLLYLKEYHKQKGIPGLVSKGFLVPGIYDYPPVFITILSKFPLRLVEKYEFLFSPFFDSLHVLAIYFLSYFATGNIAIALLTQAVYTLTPIIAIENSSATPRSLGYLLFSFVYMLLFAFIAYGNIFILLPALVCGCLIFLSHRFTTQGFLFFSIFFSLWEKNLIFLIVFIISGTLAIIFSRNMYIRVLKGHIGNLLFWRKVIRYRFFHQVKGAYAKHKTKDFVFAVYNQFVKFPPFVLTITNPWLLSLLYMGFFHQPHDILLTPLFVLSVFFFVLALVTTWVPALQFLGEGQRYLELSAFPTALFAAITLISLFKEGYALLGLSLYVAVALAALTTVVVIQRKAIIKDSLRTLTPSLQSMYVYLKKMKKKPRLLCIPHQITTNTIYHTGCEVYVNASYATILEIADVYPYLRESVKDVMKKHKLDLLLLNEAYATPKDLKLKKFKVVKQINEFSLIQVL